jgi:hypothetical protein
MTLAPHPSEQYELAIDSQGGADLCGPNALF